MFGLQTRIMYTVSQNVFCCYQIISVVSNDYYNPGLTIATSLLGKSSETE